MFHNSAKVAVGASEGADGGDWDPEEKNDRYEINIPPLQLPAPGHQPGGKALGSIAPNSAAEPSPNPLQPIVIAVPTQIPRHTVHTQLTGLTTR